MSAVQQESITPEVAALLIARDARPGLDIDATLARLDELAAPLVRQAAPADPRAQAAALAAHLHETHGYHGDEESYYDARNSYLDEVIERRRGIPITLSVLYEAVARRAGMSVHGVGFPGHFLARVGGTDGVLIDPFRGGTVVEPGMLEQLVSRSLGSPQRLQPEHLEPVSLRALVVRMLLNLARVHQSQQDHARALVVCDRLVDLTDAISFRRDRGLHALELGATAQAREDLTAYLEHVGDDAEDAPKVRAALERIDTGPTSWS